jgi:hypothetical protein
VREKTIGRTFRSYGAKGRSRGVSINIALLRSEEQSLCIVAADIFMTNTAEFSDKTFAAILHTLCSLVTRAAATRLKLASVGKNESQGE